MASYKRFLQLAPFGRLRVFGATLHGNSPHEQVGVLRGVLCTTPLTAGWMILTSLVREDAPTFEYVMVPGRAPVHETAEGTRFELGPTSIHSQTRLLELTYHQDPRLPITALLDGEEVRTFAQRPAQLIFPRTPGSWGSSPV